MPYYLHNRSSEPESGTPYAVKTEAISARVDGQTITLVASEEERKVWRDRELTRFIDKTYHDVPWYHTGFYQDKHRDHYCHLSIDYPGMVAYTPDDAFGIEDRQKRVRPAKYLQDYFGEQLSKDTIDDYAQQVRALTAELQIARSSADIISVYVNGPNSCMGGKGKGWTDSDHPVQVYGESDLGVAYLGTLDNVSARCVVWPDKKYYSRCYGDESLITLLQNHGYTNHRLDDARVRAIKVSRDQYLMPYIDRMDTADLQGEWFVLGEGDYSTSETDGVTSDQPKNTCEHCNEACDVDETYCQSCQDDSQYCEACDETYFDTAFVTVEHYSSSRRYSQDLCESCASEYAVECPVCEDTRYDRHPDTDLCSRHEHYSQCATCEEYVETVNNADLCSDCAPEDDDDTDDDTESDIDDTTPIAVVESPDAIPYGPDLILFTIELNDHTTKDVVAVCEYGPFVIHKALDGKGWSIVHKQTRLAVVSRVSSLKCAETAAIALGCLNGWDQVVSREEMPPAPFRANVLAILAEVPRVYY